MIDLDDWKPEEVAIFRQFDFRCLHCKIQFAVTLHELVPKSLAPKTWMKPENRVPLCNSCHHWAHDYGTDASRKILETEREAYLNG